MGPLCRRWTAILAALVLVVLASSCSSDTLDQAAWERAVSSPDASQHTQSDAEEIEAPAESESEPDAGVAEDPERSAAEPTDASGADPVTSDGATSNDAGTALGGTIEWSPCGAVECGTVTVPVDIEEPDLGTLDIAVGLHRALEPTDRIGVLMINPGGPGISGIEVLSILISELPGEVVDRFDLVSFDPRGVRASDPDFACGTGNEMVDILANLDFPLDEDEQEAGDRAVELCETSMGPVASRLGTDYVVDDMDLIREALGEEQITYLGFSYGSTIGVFYASEYPDHVRAMVLDGAREVVPRDDIDTLDEEVEEALAQLGPIEESVERALAECDAVNCALASSGNATDGYYQAIANAALVNEATGDPFGAGLGLFTFLYSEQTYPQLWEALVALRDGDPTMIVDAYRFQNPTEGANFTEIVNCLDDWAIEPDSDPTELAEVDEAVEAALDAELPLIGAVPIEGVPACAFFDSLDVKPVASTLDGADVPIVVVGNTSDPATPFRESERLATEVLSNGYLVKVDHETHTVYMANECVDGYVNDALIDATLPPDRLVVCEREDAVGS